MAKIRYTVTNLKKWVKAAANPVAFEAAMRTNMRRATELNGKLAEKAQRATIRQMGSTHPNAALTVMIKKSNKPLVHSGDLFQGITSSVVDDFTVFTGVLRSDSDYSIAEIVYRGATIRVTPAMRSMFFFLWKASEGTFDASKLEGRAAELFAIQPKGWKPLAESTQAIIIPERPWARIALDNADFKGQVKRNWESAMRKTFQDMTRL